MIDFSNAEELEEIISENKNLNTRPFLKWAGGKTQLLPELATRLPKTLLKDKNIDTYIEPFVGGGSLFFYLKRNFIIKQSFLSDINKELILSYKVVQKDPEILIKKLFKYEKIYLKKSETERKKFYYKVRTHYNKQIEQFNYNVYNEQWIERAAQLIFLNKTCFNGLFRQNRKGEFNVPFGRYKNPTICDESNLSEVNKALKNTKILCADFSSVDKYIKKNSLVYFDPPYRPINKTSRFTNYSKEGFTDEDQIRLANFFKAQDKKGSFLMLSNSDPKNENAEDEFFDSLYEGFVIERVMAKRAINSVSSKRGQIKELIIRNYK